MWLKVINRRKIFTSAISAYKVSKRKLKNNDLLEYCQKIFAVSEDKMERILLRHPRLEMRNEEHVAEGLEVLNSLGFDNKTILEKPQLLYSDGMRIKNHALVLKECGFIKIEPSHLIIYHNIVNKQSISQLKKQGMIPEDMDVRQRLADCFSLWPSKLRPQGTPHDDEYTPFSIRFQVLQKYLEWRIDMSKVEFEKSVRIYNPFRHRPLANMEISITLAQTEFNMSTDKIRFSPYVISANLFNTQMILEKVREINGLDIRKIINLQPTVIRAQYKSLIKISEILKEHRVTFEALLKALQLLTLKPESVKKRLVETEKMPEYQALSHNPGYMKLVAFRNRVTDRLKRLYSKDKRCFSLDKLTCNPTYYKENEFGDWQSILATMSVVVGVLRVPEASQTWLRSQLLRQSFYKNIPTTQVLNCALMLLRDYSAEDILLNSQILFYPEDTIKKHLTEYRKLQLNLTLKSDGNLSDSSDSEDEAPEKEITADLPGTLADYGDPFDDMISSTSGINYKIVSNCQMLALALYSIEIEHNFSGDGVWENLDKNSREAL